MDRLDEILPALQKHGTKTAAAKALGMTDGAFRRRYDKLMLEGGQNYSVPDLPTGELDIEELVASRKHRFAIKQKAEQAGSLIQVKMKIGGPIGIVHFGDPHCFTPKHEIMTKRGWLTYDNLDVNDEVAGIDDDGAFVWQTIDRIIVREIDEDIIVCKSETAPFECTTGHRFWMRKAVSKGYGQWKFFTADQLTNSQFMLPLAAFRYVEHEYPLTDSEIRLLGWVLTDSHWTVDGEIKAITLYQSKPDGVAKIRDTLQDNGVEFSESSRMRDGRVAANGVEFRHNYESYDFRIGVADARKLTELFGLVDRKSLPACVGLFSKRQFDVLLDVINQADGDSPSKNTIRIYKGHDFLDSLQSHALRHGYKTRMSKRAETWGDLSITDQSFGTIHPSRNISRQRYAGPVWCVTVKHGKFFTRFDGVAYLTGNCDDDGTDIAALELHTDIVRNTPGMFAANVGDTTNNWVGRLSRLYGDQTTSATEAWALAEWLMTRCPWLFVVSGNHDCWTNNGGDPLQWIARQNAAIHRPSEARIGLQFANGRQCVINARHDFAGNSQWNPAHGPMKALQMGVRDHIAICGHKHVSGYGVIKDQSDGKVCHAIQVASYKVYDRYAKERGFRDQHISPCAVTVIDPDATEASFVQLFWEPEPAADYLTWLRQKRGVK